MSPSISENLQILLADDDADDREFFSEAIDGLKAGHQLALFKDGIELTDHLNSISIESPLLLFLDLNMPRKTGLDCLREIRENPDYNNLSIAIYSTSSSEKDIEESYAAGANLYIKKPNDFSQLKNVVREVIGIDWGTRSKSPTFEDFVFTV